MSFNMAAVVAALLSWLLLGAVLFEEWHDLSTMQKAGTFVLVICVGVAAVLAASLHRGM